MFLLQKCFQFKYEILFCSTKKDRICPSYYSDLLNQNHFDWPHYLPSANERTNNKLLPVS